MRLLTGGHLELLLHVPPLLTEGEQRRADALPLLLQLLLLPEVAFGVLLRPGFPIPPVLVGIWDDGLETRVWGLEVAGSKPQGGHGK